MKSTLYHISKMISYTPKWHSYMNYNSILCIIKVNLRNMTMFLFIVESYNQHEENSPECSSSGSKRNRLPDPSSASLQQPPSITNIMISQVSGRISTLKETRVSWTWGSAWSTKILQTWSGDNLNIVILSFLSFLRPSHSSFFILLPN